MENVDRINADVLAVDVEDGHTMENQYSSPECIGETAKCDALQLLRAEIQPTSVLRASGGKPSGAKKNPVSKGTSKRHPVAGTRRRPAKLKMKKPTKRKPTYSKRWPKIK